MTFMFNISLEVIGVYMYVQNFIKLSATVYELSRLQKKNK